MPEKYDPLRDHLAGYADDQILMTFGEIEELVGPLPRGARRLRQWWGNERTAQGQAWRAGGWRVLLADISSEQVLFQRLWPLPEDPPPVGTPERADPAPRSYLNDVHLPLLGVLVMLSVIIGAIGFALRPGADKPPVVPEINFSLYATQQVGTGTAGPTRLIVEETMEQRDPSTVLVQFDVFAIFAAPGPVSWVLGESPFPSQSEPYSCPDPYEYLGKTEPDPVDFPDNQPTIGGQPVTDAELSDFTGHIQHKSAGFELYGMAPRVVRAGTIVPVAEVDMCWTKNPPMAFDGEFASASLPGINGPVQLTRNLYFDNSQENRPVTAQYSLQAGTLPTTTEPVGWHWAAGGGSGPLQLTATNIQVSQQEAYLGFLSGVLFGVVGGALVLILQELLEPIRIRRRAKEETAQ